MKSQKRLFVVVVFYGWLAGRGVGQSSSCYTLVGMKAKQLFASLRSADHGEHLEPSFGEVGEEAKSSEPKQSGWEFIPKYFENERKERNCIIGGGNKMPFIRQ